MGWARLRREEIRRYKPAVELELMRRIKAALDPQGPDEPRQGDLEANLNFGKVDLIGARRGGDRLGKIPGEC